MRFTQPALLIALALGATAQDRFSSQANVGVPLLGFAFDRDARALRPLYGVPGAAWPGDAVDPGFALSAAVVSPRGNFALALSSGDGRLRLLSLDGSNAPGAALIEDALPSPDRMALSPSGSAAALWLGSARLQSITGLPDHPQVRELALPASTAAVSALAVADDGSVALLGDDSSARLLWADGSTSLLTVPGAAAQFRPGSRDLAVAASDGALYLFDGTGTRLVQSGADPAAAPVALRFSPHGSRLYLVTAAGRISTFDLASGAVATRSCACVPTAFEPLPGPSLFRLADVSASALWLYDSATDGGRTWFVPPPQNAARPAGGAR